jgi:hypothetical protein
VKEQKITVKDGRIHGWFAVDKHLFSKDNKIGPYAILVYCVLCRLAANDTPGEAVTSRAYIAKLARISTGSVSKATQQLSEAGLISIETQRDGGKNLPSKYTIFSPDRPSYSDGRPPSPDDRHSMTVTTEPLSRDLFKDGNLEEGENKKPLLKDFSELWNQRRGSLPKVMRLTDSRKDKIKSRMAEGITLDMLTQAIDLCLKSPFLRGDNDRGWTATFDWLIENDKNMTKVLEGQYSNNGNGGMKNGNNNAVISTWLNETVGGHSEAVSGSEFSARVRPLLEPPSRQS